jgi:DNA-binding transcriptional regulator YiaG
MVHIENINGLHHAIGLHIVENTNPMTGAEFRFLRKQMQLSQAELAKRLGVTDQTVANYEKGKSGKDGLGPADPYMRAIYLLHVLPEQTRVEVIKPMIDARKEKLPDLPRQKIVECWREEDAPRIAA